MDATVNNKKEDIASVKWLYLQIEMIIVIYVMLTGICLVNR